MQEELVQPPAEFRDFMFEDLGRYFISTSRFPTYHHFYCRFQFQKRWLFLHLVMVLQLRELLQSCIVNRKGLVQKAQKMFFPSLPDIILILVKYTILVLDWS